MIRADKTLLFVTYQYPYLPGEYFIESEITYLADAFERVVVFPTRTLWWKPEQAARALPSGTQLLDGKSFPVLLKALWIFMAVFNALKYLLIHEDRDWVGRKDFPKIARWRAFLCAFKMQLIGSSVAYYLNRNLMTSSSSVTGYAYWRNESAAALCMLKAKGLLNHVFVRAHRIDLYSEQRWPSEGIIHGIADAVFPVSLDGAKFLEEEKGLPSRNIEVQRLGVSIPNDVSAASTDGVLRIVTCSNLIPVKRVALIAEVIDALDLKLEWRHIGDGPDLEVVRAITNNYPVSKKVIFMGRLSNAEVLRWYLENPVDLFVNLSESEGVPVSIMEALGYGIPVLATDVGGSSEVLNEENGRLVNVKDSARCVSAELTSFVTDARFRTVVRKAARAMAETICSSERNYKMFCRRIR